MNKEKNKIIIRQIDTDKHKMSYHHKYVSDFYAWMVKNHNNIVNEWEGEIND